MRDTLIKLDDLISADNGAKTAPIASAQFGTLNSAESEELRQLAILFAELERELGETDDPDLRFAAAFARQCALGDLEWID